MATETVPMDDRELFSAATSDQPVQEVAQEPAVETKPSDEPPRDEHGRFAPKEPETKPEETTQSQAPVEPPKEGAQASIPPWRLSEVTQERNRERERAEAAERRAEAAERAARAFQAQLQPQEPPKTPDYLDQPADFVAHTVQPHLEQLRSSSNFNSQLIAAQVHGAEAVQAAERAFTQAYESGMVDPLDSMRVLKSPNIYHAAVLWHKEQQTRQKIGGDLDGFLKKHEDGLLENPQFLARVAEKIRAQNGQGNGSQKPVVQLPPSLNKIASSAPISADGSGDMSDASLFRFATAR